MHILDIVGQYADKGGHHKFHFKTKRTHCEGAGKGMEWGRVEVEKKWKKEGKKEIQKWAKNQLEGSKEVEEMLHEVSEEIENRGPRQGDQTLKGRSLTSYVTTIVAKVCSVSLCLFIIILNKKIFFF